MSEAVPTTRGPIVRSLLEIPRAVGESDKDEECYSSFDAIQVTAQELFLVMAQGESCTIRVCSFVRDGPTTHYSRQTQVCIEFERQVQAVTFSCENDGTNQKTTLLLFALTRDGRLWCFREKDLRISGNWNASLKCAASLSCPRLLGANVLTACTDSDLPMLIAAGHTTLGPPQLIHFTTSVPNGENSPVMTMQSRDFPGMERVEPIVTSVLCLAKETMSLKLQRALGKRYLSDSPLAEPQDYDYDAAAVMGLADGTIRVSLITASDQDVRMSPARLLGWISGKDRQAVVAVVPSRRDQNLVDTLLWFGSSGPFCLSDGLDVSCICTELDHGGMLRTAVPVTADKDGGPRLVLAVKRDGTSHVYSFFGQFGKESDYDAPLTAKVPLREDISNVRGVKSFDSSLNSSTSSLFVGATTNGTLICFNFSQSVAQEIIFDNDVSSASIQSPLEQYWSDTMVPPRLESLLRSVERLEQQEEREVVASALKAAADEASNVSQMIQEVCRHGKRKRVRVRQDLCRRVAAIVDDSQNDPSKRLSVSMHVCIAPGCNETNQGAISSRTTHKGNGRDVVYGGTVVSVSNMASQHQSVAFEQTKTETTSYYTSLSIPGRKPVNSTLGMNGEQLATGLVFTAEADLIL
jgi:hypothetical protein